MVMRIYIKDDIVKDIELDISIIESLTIKRALELFVENEDFSALDRYCAADMLQTMADNRQLIEIDKLS